MPKIFEINKNQSDSQQMSPRAVIAILPFAFTEVTPIRVISQNDAKVATGDDPNLVALRNPEPVVVDPSEILSLTITEDKNSPVGTLSVLLQPSQYNYLEVCNPGDYIFAWICPDKTTSEDLIQHIRNLEACNDPKYGLKFFGKVYSAEETFQINSGVKIVRYTVTAQSFDYYQSQVFNTPEALPFENTPAGLIMYSRTFFANVVNGLTEAQNNEIFTNITFKAQDQVSYFHQCFMGAANGIVNGSSDPTTGGLFKALPNMFALPHAVGQLFGRDVQNQNSQAPLTFSDIMNVIIGVQNFDDTTAVVTSTQKNSSGDTVTITGPEQFVFGQEGGIGPSNFIQGQVANAGKIYQPNNANYYIKGIRLINITASIRGTIWQILKEHSNPLINEMYTCLRLDPKSDIIFPTFICRQIPMSFNLPGDDFPVTYFDDLPRFRIDKSNILAYSLNKNNELRMNMFFVQPLVSCDTGSQLEEDAINLANVGYQIDGQDARKHGIRLFSSQVYENFLTDKVADKDQLTSYSKFVRDINANLHLKLNGNLVTWGITDFICIGENLQLGDDLLFHIEKITHNYAIQSGLPVFRTSFDLSHGVAIDPTNLSTIGEKPKPSNSPDEVYSEFKPSFNVFSPIKGKSNTDSLNQVRGNSFNNKSVPDTSQATVLLDKTNGEGTE